MKHTKKKRLLAVVLCMILVLSTGIAAFANENVGLQSVACQATTLERVIKNADGEEVGTLVADIPEGAFLASSSDANIQMDVQADTGADGVLSRVQQQLETNGETGYTLNNYVMADVTFYVNGEKQVPQQPITFTVKGTSLDSQKAVAFSDDRQNNPEFQEVTEITEEDGSKALQFTAETTSETVVYGLAEKEEAQAENQDDVENTENKEPEAITYEQNYSDDQIDINVTAGEGVVPENAELKVTPIVKTDITDNMSAEEKAKAAEINDQYDLTEKKLNESSEEDGTKLSGFLAYDISFLVNGEEVEPNGDVSVKMNFREAVKPEGVTDNSFVEVKHLKEDTTADDGVKVENLNENTNVETTDAVEVQKVELTADSFSTFAITWGNLEAQVNVKYVDENGNELTSDQFNADTLAMQKINNQVTFFDNKTCPKATYAPSPVVIDRNEYVYQCVKIDGIEVNAVRTNAKDYTPFQYEYRDTSNKWHQWTTDRIVYFVYKKELTEVETVDSTSDGIIMRMIDYGGDTKGTLTNGSNSINIGGGYGSGNIKQGLLQKKLGSNGYPIATVNNKSLAFLFSENAQKKQDVNHLFRKDIYEQTGYYEYSSFNNYAYLNEDGNFTVYDQIGTPVDGSSYFYRRGNFMPYNKIAAGKYSSYTNGYDEDGNPLAETDPAYGKPLYKTQGDNNYLFGMYMEANFIQPKGGINTRTQQNMRYEFNGDDDMWIYIDGVLVLDIGGIHDAHSGSIDFKTGVVEWYDCNKGGTPKRYTTTIKACFKAAGVLPNGQKWNDTDAANFFEGDTFKNYTSHTMKMFYMERGAGASNLHMKFNLEVMPKGAIQVEKQLTNTDKQKYSSMDFGFQVYAQKIFSKDDTSRKETYSDEYELLDADTIAKEGITATYSKGSKKGQTVAIGSQTFEDKTYEGVFLLKSDEAVNFTGLQADRKYYIKEVGVSANEYDKVWINEKLYENKDSGIFEIEGDKASVESRPYVVCYNNCSAANSRELKITKKMANGQEAKGTFTFKIQLSDQNGKLTPYANGDYYLITTKDNTRTYYHYDENKNLQPTSKAVVCGKTDENGLVTGVPAGYTVVVTQILSETNFLVTEENLNKNYQTPQKEVVKDTFDPATIEGADGAIKLGTDAEVIITNTLKERLQVEKKWEGSDEPETTVYVGLYQINKDKSTTPVEGRYVALNEDNNWKGLFEGLDGSYTVKELRKTTDGETSEFTINDEGYIGLDAGDTIEVSGTTYRVSYGNKSTGAGGLSKIDITNATVWQIKKISANSTTDKKLYLKGAEFAFTDAKENVIYARSDDNGLVHFYSDHGYTTEVYYLPDGAYKVKETKAPTGYSLSTTEWKLTVENSLVKDTNLTKATKNDNETMETYYLTNTPLYELPHTGGPGIYLFTIGGILLMGAAAWILYKNKCREVLKR